MPSMDALAKTKYTPADWLLYYRNIWSRNLVARTIDVYSDKVTKEKNPNETVASDDGAHMPVKQRLEMRKIAVQDALDLIKSIDDLIAQGDKFEDMNWSDAALAIAPDMLKKPEPEVGSPCTIDGKPGVWMKQGDKMVCMLESDKKPADAAAEKKDAGV